MSEQLKEQIAELKKQRTALIGYAMNYARCKPDCKFGNEKADGTPEPCTCGWLEDHAEVGRTVFDLKT